MDHLGIDKFAVLGFYIAGPFIWNLIKRAPNRVVAAVPAQPVGFRPEGRRNRLYESQSTGWGDALIKRRPEITKEQTDRFLTKMFLDKPDFVFTVTRDFVKSCQTPVLGVPDDTPGRFLRGRDRKRHARAQGPVEHVPWERHAGEDPGGGAARAQLPAVASAGVRHSAFPAGGEHLAAAGLRRADGWLCMEKIW